jgi:hypothetical protein
MPSLRTAIESLATRAGGELKAHKVLLCNNAADLGALSTAAKGNLVAAVNEVAASVAALGTPATINDAVTSGTQTWSSNKITAHVTAAIGSPLTLNDAATNSTQTWSSNKINSSINSAVAAVVASSPAALDTLNELAAALGNDYNFATTITTALGKRVRVDAAQTFTAGEQSQGQLNLNLGDCNAADFVATFNAALV